MHRVRDVQHERRNLKIKLFNAELFISFRRNHVSVELCLICISLQIYGREPTVDLLNPRTPVTRPTIIRDPAMNIKIYTVSIVYYESTSLYFCGQDIATSKPFFFDWYDISCWKTICDVAYLISVKFE